MEKRTREVLIKFLNNQCTVEEEHQVNQILERPDGLALLHQLMQELDAAAEDSPRMSDDILAPRVIDWQQRINQRIVSAAGDDAGRTARIRPIGNFAWLRYAAILIGFLLMTSIVFWRLNNVSFRSGDNIVVENNNPKRVPVAYTLPDNTQVFLAFGSKLRYPRRFNGNIREVSLEGDAFFEVTRNETMPFIVRSGEINTQVLGTSFRIKTSANQSVVVSVATGKVYVSKKSGNKENQLALLTKGRKVTWDAGAGRATVGTVDIYALEQWKEGDLYFEEETMADIARELQHRYNIRIRFEDNTLGMKRVSGSFASGKAVDKIINTLSVAGKFSFSSSAEKKEFIIYKINKPAM
jgi:transmembrane sensor